jgi:hypothetical protein
MKMLLKKDIYPTAQARPRRPGFEEQFLDQSQARGEFIVSVDQLAQAGQMTHVAVPDTVPHPLPTKEIDGRGVEGTPNSLRTSLIQGELVARVLPALASCRLERIGLGGI